MTREPDPEGARIPANRPLRRDAEQNRLRILAAAREVFAARGVDVMLDDIAAHAGVGVGTLYRRFPSREHLVEALFDQQLEKLLGLAEEAMRQPDAWTGLTTFFERAAELTADRGLRDVLFSRAYGRDRVAAARGRIGPVVQALVERCQEAGVLRPDVAGADLVLLQFMTAALMDYTSEVEPGLWRRYQTIIFDGLRRAATELPVGPPDVQMMERIGEHWRPPRRPEAE